jgi:hypothetical protein
MSDEGKHKSKATFQPDLPHGGQEYYAFRINGHLAASWSETFDGMQITRNRGGETLITGAVRDQAALHGILARIRDLNLTLISVTRVNQQRFSRPHTKNSAN